MSQPPGFPSKIDPHSQIKSEDHFESPDIGFPTDPVRQEAKSFMQKWTSASALHQSDQARPRLDSNLQARDRSPPADRIYHPVGGRGTADRAYTTAPPEQSRMQPSVEVAAASTAFTQPNAGPPPHQLNGIWLEAHPPFAPNQASNYHSTTLSRYLAEQYSLPLSQDLSQSIPSRFPPRVRTNMADHVLRSSPGAAPQLIQWIESRLRQVCPAGSGDVTYWIYSEPDSAQQWRVY